MAVRHEKHEEGRIYENCRQDYLQRIKSRLTHYRIKKIGVKEIQQMLDFRYSFHPQIPFSIHHFSFLLCPHDWPRKSGFQKFLPLSDCTLFWWWLIGVALWEISLNEWKKHTVIDRGRLDLVTYLHLTIIGPFPLTQIVALIWVAIRIATQISATILIFMCGDRKVAIISAILIAYPIMQGFLSACVVCLRNWHRSNRCDLGCDFSACVDTRKK